MKFSDYHYIIAIEYVWSSEENNVTSDLSLQSLHSLLEEAFSKIKSSEQEKHYTYIESIENEYWRKD